MDDPSLLRRYVENRDESAFAEIVRQHLALVYNTALRRLNGDAHHAHDVSQTVFTLLAHKAPSLIPHPTLTGWLYNAAINSARELIRAEQRRVAREQETHAMQDPLSSTPSDESWRQLRPVIDEGLNDLKPADRDALLLRYFEDRPLSQVATTLRLSEDGARMRINRALEKLRNALSKRGVTSTASAITITLAPNISLAAPTGMAEQIAGSALSLSTAATASVGTGVTALALLNIMATSKIVTGTIAVIALCVAGLKTHELSKIRSDLADLQNKSATMLGRTRSLENELAAERRKSREADEDNARMLAAVESSKTVNPPTSPAIPAPLTKETVDARYKRAGELERGGQPAEALAEYLWCYDEGMLRFPDFKGVRVSFLLSAIGRLGKNYPPAMEALHERRDKTAELMVATPTDRDAVLDFAALNDALGEKEKNLELYDQLSPDSPLRKGLLVRVYDQLIDAKRYTDAVSARPYSRMLSDLTRHKTDLSQMPPTTQPHYRKYIVTATAKNIQVLAGAGNLQNAKALADQLLAFDNSPEAKALVSEHLNRAGHGSLLGP